MGKEQNDLDEKYWADNEVFNTLCEVVMQNRLICLTGAGISNGLELKDGTKAPDWKELLVRLTERLDDKLNDEQKKDIKELLTDKPIGEELIEAATILKKADKGEFNTAFVNSVRLKEGVYNDIHKQLLKLCPNGIITYNYDEAHENAMNIMKENWSILTPYDEQQINNIILNRFEDKFLLKAHGTVNKEDSMVLTRDAYRDLFVKCPAYKAFLQNLFTNYQSLIVGFGFSDPDFELLIKDIFSSYGSPIQKHIVIKHEQDKSSIDTLYKLRYGMRYLYVKNYDDIPKMLDDCISSGGTYMDNIVKRCVSKELEERSKVHKEIRSMSLVGKKCLASKLMTQIKKIVEMEKKPGYDKSTELSELVYSFGILLDVDSEYKNFLIENVIEKSMDSEPVAHALVTISSHLVMDDIKKIDKWKKRIEENPFRMDDNNPDPHNRTSIYCKYLKAYVEAKYASHSL